MSKHLFIGCVFFFCIHSLFAQIENNKIQDGKVIKAAAEKKDLQTIQTQKKDTSKLISHKKQEEGQAQDPGMDFGKFDFYKEPMVVSRDTLSKSLGELRVVKVSEELKIDCVWVKAAEYYEIWDSKYLNPYKKDASLFKDTVNIRLYNRDVGELWSAPLAATLQTSGFGYRWGRFHHGIDLNLRMGTPIFSVFDGIVRISAYQRGYGNYVVVRHKNGLETLYAHMSLRKVKIGQEVKAGQLLGLGGSTGWSTGPHLHFEIRYEGNSFNPLLLYNFSKKEQLISEYFKLMPQHFRHLGNRVKKTITHKVLEGETLSIISAKYNVSVNTLVRLNRLTTNSKLKAGQNIYIIK